MTRAERTQVSAESRLTTEEGGAVAVALSSKQVSSKPLTHVRAHLHRPTDGARRRPATLEALAPGRRWRPSACTTGTSRRQVKEADMMWRAGGRCPHA